MVIVYLVAILYACIKYLPSPEFSWRNFGIVIGGIAAAVVIVLIVVGLNWIVTGTTGRVGYFSCVYLVASIVLPEFILLLDRS